MANGSSDFNLQRVSTKELGENIRATIEFGGNVFMAGPRGSGKTSICKDVIRECGKREVYLNASTFDRCDMSGFPKMIGAEKERFVQFLLPEFYRSLVEGNEPCVVLFDEVDKADPSIVAPLLEFVQLHSINGTGLKNLLSTLMTGNLVAEGGNRPALPLLDRAEKFLVDPNLEDWFEWGARTGEIHASIAAYLNDHQADLMGDTDPGENYSTPSPRGWHYASRMLKHGEAHRWSNDLLKTKIGAILGKKVGIKYAAYFDHYIVLLPIVEEIFKGKLDPSFHKMEPTRQLVTTMMVCTRVANEISQLKSGQKSKHLNSVGHFLKEIDPEMALISFRSQIGAQNLMRIQFNDYPEFNAVLDKLAKRLYTK